ncbi:MAG: AAA family ATPase [Chitinophagales bacterium]
MHTKKRLIRGEQNYQTFIEMNGYYVDKTLFVKEILDNEHKVMLITRPRRFGKSLNLSMLRFFFDINQKDTQKLFEPYKIWQTGDYYTRKQGKYPVIEVSLKDASGQNFKDCLLYFQYIIAELFREHTYLLKSEELDDVEKSEFNQIYQKKANEIDYKTSLKKLSTYLEKHHHQKVIILVDEYDSPIHTGYRNGYYDEIIDFMQHFLGGAFKGNNSLHKGVVTGILRIAKESMFSEWNNPGVYTMRSYEFSDKFGFTESETKSILAHFNLEDQFELVKKWYDGYKIGDSEHLYNPWSISGYLGKHREGFKAHWVNTSSDELIRERIVERTAEETRNDIEVLLSGKTIVKEIDENLVFADFEDPQKELLWTLLFFGGYLIPVEQEDDFFYQLKIPNYEIAFLFRRFVLDWLKTGVGISSSILYKMVENLTHNRIDKFEKYLKQIMGDTFSYFDANKEAEKVWQAYVLGLLAMSSNNYIIKSNRESGAGRYDILMLPREDKTMYGIVIEVKAMDKDATPQQIGAKLTEALGQITKNKYYKELIAQNIPKRIEIAMVFAGKEIYVEAKNS